MSTQGITTKIGIAIKNSPTLYPLFLRVRGRYDCRSFPSPNTDIHVTGYARCGNTFSAGLLARVFPTLNIATHVHSPAPIKLALRHGVPVIILIRDPADCLPSSILRRPAVSWGGDPALFVLREYINYYAFVLRNIDKVTVLEFERLISDPSILIDAVNEALPHARVAVSDREFARHVEGVKAELKRDKRPAAQNAWHSAEKNKMKGQIRSRINDIAEYAVARKLFGDILEQVK